MIKKLFILIKKIDKKLKENQLLEGIILITLLVIWVFFITNYLNIDVKIIIKNYFNFKISDVSEITDISKYYIFMELNSWKTVMHVLMTPEYDFTSSYEYKINPLLKMHEIGSIKYTGSDLDLYIFIKELEMQIIILIQNRLTVDALFIQVSKMLDQNPRLFGFLKYHREDIIRAVRDHVMFTDFIIEKTKTDLFIIKEMFNTLAEFAPKNSLHPYNRPESENLFIEKHIINALNKTIEKELNQTNQINKEYLEIMSNKLEAITYEQTGAVYFHEKIIMPKHYSPKLPLYSLDEFKPNLNKIQPCIVTEDDKKAEIFFNKLLEKELSRREEIKIKLKDYKFIVKISAKYNILSKNSGKEKITECIGENPDLLKKINKDLVTELTNCFRIKP